MTGRVAIVCRPSVATAFGLIGLTPVSAPEATDPAPAVGELLQHRDVAVLLVEDTIYDGLPVEQRARLDRSAHPVVIPFPGPAPAAAPSAEERVVALLRRAIGYRVRLQ